MPGAAAQVMLSLSCPLCGNTNGAGDRISGGAQPVPRREFYFCRPPPQLPLLSSSDRGVAKWCAGFLVLSYDSTGAQTGKFLALPRGEKCILSRLVHGCICTRGRRVRRVSPYTRCCGRLSVVAYTNCSRTCQRRVEHVCTCARACKLNGKVKAGVRTPSLHQGLPVHLQGPGPPAAAASRTASPAQRQHGRSCGRRWQARATACVQPSWGGDKLPPLQPAQRLCTGCDPAPLALRRLGPRHLQVCGCLRLRPVLCGGGVPRVWRRAPPTRSCHATAAPAKRRRLTTPPTPSFPLAWQRRRRPAGRLLRLVQPRHLGWLRGAWHAHSRSSVTHAAHRSLPPKPASSQRGWHPSPRDWNIAGPGPPAQRCGRARARAPGAGPWRRRSHPTQRGRGPRRQPAAAAQPDRVR